MKHILTFIICLMSFGVTQCQNENTGGKLFKEIDGDGFVCISEDTLSFASNKDGYYFGPYSLQDSTIRPGRNILSNRSYNIFLENCDSSIMEIAVSFWNRPWFTDTYDSVFIEDAFRTILFYGDDNQLKESEGNGVVTFSSIELKSLSDTLSCFVFVDGYPYHTYLSVPVRKGVRYHIVQKEYGMVPLITEADEVPWTKPIIYFKKNKKQIEFYFGPRYSIEFNYVGDCSSCLEELRKRHPEL